MDVAVQCKDLLFYPAGQDGITNLEPSLYIIVRQAVANCQHLAAIHQPCSNSPRSFHYVTWWLMREGQRLGFEVSRRGLLLGTDYAMESSDVVTDANSPSAFLERLTLRRRSIQGSRIAIWKCLISTGNSDATVLKPQQGSLHTSH